MTYHTQEILEYLLTATPSEKMLVGAMKNPGRRSQRNRNSRHAAAVIDSIVPMQLEYVRIDGTAVWFSMSHIISISPHDCFDFDAYRVIFFSLQTTPLRNGSNSNKMLARPHYQKVPPN